MDVPPPATLIDRVRSLPAGGPLLARLGATSGVYLVGGAVRDLLLGGAPTDLDLVVEGDAAAIAASLGGELRVHDRFGTSTVGLDGFSYDFARARTETYSRPGALPEVEPAPLKEDLLRRDFTINAIAVALGPPQPGAVREAPGAIEDLGGRRIRVLHDRSFADDPTRLLRLVRYASRLSFAVEAHTLDLIAEAVRAQALQTVSGPRMGAELRLLANEPDPVAALSLLGKLRLAGAVHPAFGLADAGVTRRALALLPPDGRVDTVVLACAAQAVPAEELGARLEGLAFAAAQRDAIVDAATRAGAVAQALQVARRPSEIAAVLAGGGPELAALAGALGPEQSARDWLMELRQVRLEIDGQDLLAAGVPEGPAIGAGLRAALAAKLDGRAAGRERELAVAVAAAGGKRPRRE